MTNTKTLLALLLLLLVLGISIMRTAAAGRHKITWLEDIDRRITPLALEEIVGPPEKETPFPIASTPCDGMGAPEATPTAVEAAGAKETQAGDGITRTRTDLERAVDLLPETGRMGRSYFTRLAEEMEACRLKLRSPDPELRREGELIGHRLARQMVEDRGSCKGEALEAMDRCMSEFVDGVRETCLRRRFQPSPGRTAFTHWAAGRLESDDKSVLLFLIGLSGIMGDGSSVEAVGRYRRSADPVIRSAAIWTMGMHGSPDVIDDIGDILSDRSLPAAEGEAFMVALGRIGNRRSSGVLYGVMREAPPLLAYDAYLLLRELRGQAGEPLSLEEFVRGRGAVVDEYAAWLKKDRQWDPDGTTSHTPRNAPDMRPKGTPSGRG